MISPPPVASRSAVDVERRAGVRTPRRAGDRSGAAAGCGGTETDRTRTTVSAPGLVPFYIIIGDRR